jgi:hypothetical protein
MTRAALLALVLFPLAAGAFRVSGVVRLSDAPADLSGSVVRLGEGGPETSTGSDGSYAFEGISAGSYRIAASRAGYRTAAADVDVDADIEVDLTLKRVFRLDGEALLSDTLAPVAGTSLTLSGPEGNRFATTDAAGAFAFDDLVAGSYTVFASRPCYQPASAEVAIAADARVTLTLASSRQSVRGSVTLAGRTGDQSGTEVRLEQTGADPARVVTDPLGRYEHASVCPGVYTLTASRRGYGVRSILVAVAGAPVEVTPIELAPLGGFTLLGTVQVEGGDASGVEVRIEELADAGTVTDGSGAYRIVDIPFGVYTVVASKAGFFDARVPGLEIGADGRLDFTLRRLPTPRAESGGCQAGGGGPWVLGVLLALAAALASRRTRSSPTRG